VDKALGPDGDFYAAVWGGRQGLFLKEGGIYGKIGGRVVVRGVIHSNFSSI
jgi:hypothetical protein